MSVAETSRTTQALDRIARRLVLVSVFALIRATALRDAMATTQARVVARIG